MELTPKAAAARQAKRDWFTTRIEALLADRLELYPKSEAGQEAGRAANMTFMVRVAMDIGLVAQTDDPVEAFRKLKVDPQPLLYLAHLWLELDLEQSMMKSLKRISGQEIVRPKPSRHQPSIIFF
jgi:hypothetical protein